METKQFKVVAHSSNTNSFGLRQFVAIAQDGTAFSACANSLNLPEKNSLIKLELSKTKTLNFSSNGMWELPEQLPDAPLYLVQEIWAELY